MMSTYIPPDTATAAADYFDQHRIQEDDIKVVFRRANIQPEDHVLIAGCGTFHLAMLVAPRTSGMIIGLDTAPMAVQDAMARIPQIHRHQVSFWQQELTGLQPRNPSTDSHLPLFNVVFVSWCPHRLGHVGVVQASLSAIKTHLAPDARLVFDWCYKNEHAYSAAAVLWPTQSDSDEHRRKIQWINRDVAAAAVLEFKEVMVDICGLRIHEELQLTVGGDQYLDATSTVPPTFLTHLPQFMEFLDHTSPAPRPLILTLAANGSTLYQLIQFLRAIRSDPDYTPRAYVCEQIPPSSELANDRLEANGSKWSSSFVPMYVLAYTLVLWLNNPRVHNLTEEAAFALTDVSHYIQGYRVSGVFKV